MRHTAIASFFTIGLSLAIANTLVAAGPGGGHASGTPSAGSQSFGRPSLSPQTGGTSSGTATQSGSSIGTGSPSPFSSGPSSTGSAGALQGSGLPSGIGGAGSENNGYPLTPAEGGGELSNGQPGGTASANAPQSGSNTANTANTANFPGANDQAHKGVLPFQGRWWYPIGRGQWVYWDPPTSSWVFFPGTSTYAANGADTDGQYSSGYRGLSNAGTNGDANRNSASAANRWYWRNGQWFWFDGQTFQPAK